LLPVAAAIVHAAVDTVLNGQCSDAGEGGRGDD
jgi:hypothetical protein